MKSFSGNKVVVVVVVVATMELNHVTYLLGYPIVSLVANIRHPPTC